MINNIIIIIIMRSVMIITEKAVHSQGKVSLCIGALSDLLVILTDCLVLDVHSSEMLWPSSEFCSSFTMCGT